MRSSFGRLALEYLEDRLLPSAGDLDVVVRETIHHHPWGTEGRMKAFVASAGTRLIS